MKRNPHLKPLSQQHHEGLIIVHQLKQGLAQHADPEAMREYAVAAWDDHLHDHCELEETHLLPELRRLSAHKYAWRLVLDHEFIRDLIDRLRTPHARCRSTLSVLVEVLGNHIRFEERELFPFVEYQLDETRLGRIARYLHVEDDPPLSTELHTTFRAKQLH